MINGTHRIRAGAGLGDAIYLRAVVEELLRRGECLEVCTHYPELFADLDVKVEPFSRENIRTLAHYVDGKTNHETNQWQDICRRANVDAPLRIERKTGNEALVAEVRAFAAGRPVVLAHGGRVPMARKDGFGMGILPSKVVFDCVLEQLSDCYVVHVGKPAEGDQVYTFAANLDLSGQTKPSELLDLGAACDALVGQPSFVIPLAEVFDKPLLVVWGTGCLHALNHYYLRAINPQKVLSKTSSKYVMDDWDKNLITGWVREFRAAF